MVMRVPELQQQFRYQDPRVPAARLQGMQVQTNADMFGAQSGRQLEKAGYLVQRGAEHLGQLYDDYNNAQVQEALDNYQQQGWDMQSEKDKLQGKHAIGLQKEMQGWGDKEKQNIIAKMNDVQRGHFMHVAGRVDARMNSWAAGKEEREVRNYQNSVDEGTILTNRQRIMLNADNPDEVKEGLLNIRSAIERHGARSGLDEEMIQGKINEGLQQALVPMVESTIDAGNLAEARRMMGNYNTLLGGAKGQLEKKITREARRQEAEARAAEADLHFTTANQGARELRDGINRGDISVSDAMIQISNIPNPKLQHQTQTNFNQLMRIEEQITREAENKGRVDATDAFDRLESPDARWNAVQEAKRLALAADATPQQKAYSRRMQEMYKADVEYSEAGIKSGSSPTAFDAMTEEVERGTTLEQAKASENWPKLSTSARRSFETSIKEGMRFDVKEAVQAYDDLHRQNTGREYSKKKDQGDREACLQFVMDNVRATGKGKDPAYIQQLVDKWWRKGSVSNSGRFFDTSGTYGKLRNEGQFLPEIEDTRRQQILNMFNANPNVKEAWRKAYGGDLNYAIRGYAFYQDEKKFAPRGAQ